MTAPDVAAADAAHDAVPVVEVVVPNDVDTTLVAATEGISVKDPLGAALAGVDKALAGVEKAMDAVEQVNQSGDSSIMNPHYARTVQIALRMI